MFICGNCVCRESLIWRNLLPILSLYETALISRGQVPGAHFTEKCPSSRVPEKGKQPSPQNRHHDSVEAVRGSVSGERDLYLSGMNSSWRPPLFTCTVCCFVEGGIWSFLSLPGQEFPLSRTPTQRSCQDIPLPISRVRDVRTCKPAGEGGWLLGSFECKMLGYCVRRLCVILGSPKSYV